MLLGTSRPRGRLGSINREERVMRGSMMEVFGAMLGGPFGPPPWFYEDMEKNTLHMDGVTLSILAGMAKPGDDQETIRKNIATAREYAKEVEAQWKQSRLDERKAERVRGLECQLSEIDNDISNKEKSLGNKRAALAEQNRIIEASGLLNVESPQSLRGKTLILERAEIENAVRDREERLEECKRQRERVAKEIDEAKGVKVDQTITGGSGGAIPSKG
jgi:uncharacterized membrane protein